MQQPLIRNGKNFFPIPDYDGLYAISEDGDILRLSRTIPYSKDNLKTCLLKEFKMKFTFDKDGYYKTQLVKNGDRFYYRVHRLVALTFLPPMPIDKIHINHKDGNKINNHFSNLEWCTIKENNQHAWRLGLSKPSKMKRGGDNVLSKLTNEQAEEIRNSNISLRKMAAKYGVAQSVIWGIKKGLRYKVD